MPNDRLLHDAHKLQLLCEKHERETNPTTRSVQAGIIQKMACNAHGTGVVDRVIKLLED